MDFPDRIHLDKIRSALWNGKEFGKAAIFVALVSAEMPTRSAYLFPLFLFGRTLQKDFSQSFTRRRPTRQLRLTH